MKFDRYALPLARFSKTYLENVDLASTTGGLGYLRDRLSEESVKHAALAHVRSPEERDLR